MTVRLEELLAAATPGPWNVREEAGTGLYDVWFGDSLDSASISYAAMSVERADAALIALVPEMARLLIDMGDALRGVRGDARPDYEKRRALLARLDRLGNTA